MVERKGNTDDKGEAHFTGLDAKPDLGLPGRGRKRRPPNTRANRFACPGQHGRAGGAAGESGHARFVGAADRPGLALHLSDYLRRRAGGRGVAPGAHSSTAAVDVPASGLHFPLPDARRAGPTPDSRRRPPSASTVTTPAGARAAAARRHRAAGHVRADLQKTVSSTSCRRRRWPSRHRMVTEKIDGLSLTGDSAGVEERELQGRKLLLYRGPGTSAAAASAARPGYRTPMPTWRFLAAGWRSCSWWRSASGRARRRRQGRRAAARAEARAPARGAGGAGEARRRRQARPRSEELTEKLAGIYRELDEVAMNASPSFNAVEAHGLTGVYGRQRALARRRLALRAGEAVALLGPNGAGKSTLVGILATLVPPSTGEVPYGGREAPTRSLRGAIGVIAHESLCYGDLTGRENLRFFARLYGVAAPRARRRAARAGRLERRSRPAAGAHLLARHAAAALGGARAGPPAAAPARRRAVHRARSLGRRVARPALAEERARGADAGGDPRLRGGGALVDRVVVLARGRIAHDAPRHRRAAPR